jgi:hypothetical protein
MDNNDNEDEDEDEDDVEENETTGKAFAASEKGKVYDEKEGKSRTSDLAAFPFSQ